MSKRTGNFSLSTLIADTVMADEQVAHQEIEGDEAILTTNDVEQIAADAEAEIDNTGGLGIGAVSRKLILANPQATNKQVLERIQKLFGDKCKTTAACIAWYRNDLIKKGLLQSGAKRNIAKIMISEADLVL